MKRPRSPWTDYAAFPGTVGSRRQLAGMEGSGIRDPGSGSRVAQPARPQRHLLQEPQGSPGGDLSGWDRGRAGPPRRRAGRGWVFGLPADPSPGWSAAPPRPPPSGLCGGSGSGGAGDGGGGAGRGAAPRARGQADGRWQQGRRRGPRAGCSPGLGPPILPGRGECDEKLRCVCVPVCRDLIWVGRRCVCPSGCGWGHRCFSKAVLVSVHVRRVLSVRAVGGFFGLWLLT